VSRWHLVTGEYPPGGGGIGDYTRLLAAALAEGGDEVHVWTTGTEEAADAAEHAQRRIALHRVGAFGPAGLRRLSAGLEAMPGPRRLLIQYAPQAMGRRGLNIPFCRWALARRRAGDDVRVMFHEPFFPFGWQRPQRNLLAAVNRVMAGLLLRASTRAYVSTSAWTALLRPLAPRALPIATLPIPSTIPFADHPGEVARIRRTLLGDSPGPLLVHFGTYGDLIAPGLVRVLREAVRRHPRGRILLLGRGGPAFAQRLRGADPAFEDALVAPGALEAEDVSLHLQAADAALQPYPDGADTRRTTLMACLANGVPTITSHGRFTDAPLSEAPLWFAPPDDPERMAGAVLDQVLSSEVDRPAIRDRYRGAFSMRHTVERLRSDGERP
jgi:glycosyltransferase involved in cell wall biosynthesis